MKNYRERFDAARKGRKRRWANLLFAVAVCTILLPFVIAIFNKYDIQIKFEGEITRGRLDLVSGIGFKVGNSVFPIFDARTVRIKYLGYEELVADVPESISNPFQIELRLLSKEVNLIPDTFIDSPIWMIDGNIVSYETKASLRLTPGEYEVSLIGKNIDEVRKLIKLIPDENLDEIQIPVSKKNIHVVLNTAPSGASALLAGNILGLTPLDTYIEADHDKQLITLSKDGYNARTVEFSASSSEFLRSLVLEYETRDVTISLSPTGGVLIVNDEVVDSSKETINLPLYKSLENSISYAKYGFSSFQINSSLTGNRLDIALQPILAEIIVEATPQAIVYIDNNLLGETPLKAELQIGQYQIELVADGYASVKKNIELLQGSSFILKESLETMFSYLDRISPSSYTNSLSMNMIKVTGTDFYMGAPRSERGQRANEIIRDIGFSRKFYVSEAELTKRQFSKYNPAITASDEPVSNISWLEAVKFCNWLSASEGLDPFYIISGDSVQQNLQSLGYRLPSEAEWEFLAKKNNKRSQTIFIWGNEYEIENSAGNIADATADGEASAIISSYNDSIKGLGAIKSFPAKNSFYDLSGNVSELVTDNYSLRSPTQDKHIDYINRDPGIQRVIKGSNYLSSSWTELRASFREPINYDIGRQDVGFRVARYVH